MCFMACFRFDTHLKRHPLQKVSIGLATPRVRKCKDASEGNVSCLSFKFLPPTFSMIQ